MVRTIKASNKIKIKNNKNNKNNKQQNQAAEPKEMPSKITYQEGITVGELAENLMLNLQVSLKIILIRNYG